MAGLLDESTGEPDGVDGVLITGGASTSACLVREEELREGDDHKDFVHAFNAYAPAGTVTGQLVYVNYARYRCLVQ